IKHIPAEKSFGQEQYKISQALEGQRVTFLLFHLMTGRSYQFRPGLTKIGVPFSSPIYIKNFYPYFIKDRSFNIAIYLSKLSSAWVSGQYLISTFPTSSSMEINPNDLLSKLSGRLSPITNNSPFGTFAFPAVSFKVKSFVYGSCALSFFKA